MDITYVHTFNCTINTHTLGGLLDFQWVYAYTVVKACTRTHLKCTHKGACNHSYSMYSPYTSADTFLSHVCRKTHTAHIFKSKSCLLNTVCPDAHTLTHTHTGWTYLNRPIRRLSGDSLPLQKTLGFPTQTVPRASAKTAVSMHYLQACSISFYLFPCFSFAPWFTTEALSVW